MNQASGFFEKYFYWFSIPTITVLDIIEILIIAVVAYEILKWVKATRAWALCKGLAVLFIFMAIAALLQFNTILWIFSKTINVGIIAIIIVFQPEFRRALEQLGRKNILSSLFSFDDNKENSERFSERTVTELIRASFEMGKVKTGALMVLEKEVALGEYERTGINVDAAISSQLIINIFEHNTPLHDGAVIIRDNRILSATCYLPLTDNLEVNKELGTRHRAAIGISEVSDSITIVVSEETGKVSIATGGKLYRNVDGETMRKILTEDKKLVNSKIKLWKGRMKNEKKSAK